MDQQRAAVGDARAPVADVGAGRAVAVGAVDVQHVDRAVDVAVGGVGERGHVAHPSATPARAQVGVEHGAVASAASAA